MIINHHKRFIIYSIPKTGSTSVIEFFNKSEDCWKRNKHVTPAMQMKRFPKQKDFAQYAFFREPYSRIESSFRHIKYWAKVMKIEMISFEEFIKGLADDDHWIWQFREKGYVLKPQSDWVEDYVKLYRFDDLEKGSREIAKKHNVETKGKFPHINQVNKGMMPDWTDKLKGIYREAYKQDFDIWENI